MGKINVLSFAVANLIAAGEVVDRPSSVIKELLENAIDSGADRITVEIQNGGITYMRVTDNGCGISPEDLPVAIRRHATSKIKNAEDLDGIMTLGFRGEALAAIASVSKLRIISKMREADMGAILESEAGNILGVTERACADGTSVIVEELFANVPARLKFLKKDTTEAMAVAAMVEKIALSKPHIAFKLIIDGKLKLETVGDGNLKNTVYSVFGKEFASKLIESSIEIDGIKIHGFIGRPDNVRANRNYQNFFINGRYVKTKTALAAVEQAYTSYIASDKFPCCILFITINPATVDVNVHPAKLEVKFSNEKPVFEAVYYAVRNALESDTARPSVTLSQPSSRVSALTSQRVSDREAPIEDGKRESLKARQLQSELYVAPEQPKQAPAANPQQTFMNVSASDYLKYHMGMSAQPKDTSPSVKSATEETATAQIPTRTAPSVPKVTVQQTQPSKAAEEPVAQKTAPTPPAVEDMQRAERVETVVLEERRTVEIQTAPKKLEWRIIGEAFNSYVIVESGDKMLIIDKHAAHERIIFEQLKASMNKNNGTTSQLLMLPIEVMLTSDEIEVLQTYRSEIEAVGFEFTAGRYTASISAIPEGIEADAVADMITVMVGRIKSNTGSAKLTRDIIFEKALYQASCKAAIKAGREYPKEYTEWVVSKLMELPDVTVCPHGRPVAMELTKKNLDYQFERS